MKRYIKCSLLTLAAIVMTGCSKEHPFGSGADAGQGQVLKSSFQVELANEEAMPVLYRSSATPTVNDFKIDFIKEGETAPFVSYNYDSMPEVVTLPVGAFTAVATFGDNKTHAWEEPFFKGDTKFVVVADRTTTDIDPIVAKLANVRVSVFFSPELKAVMGNDAKVTVKVGESGTLDFTHNDAERSGYFQHVENSKSLTATFTGTVDGYPVTESKVYDNVAPGTHYKVTFKLHTVDEDETGGATLGLVVDATVTTEDMNVNVDPEDQPIEDDMRPTEGKEENPDPGKDPVEEETAPAITSAVPDPAGEYASFKPVDLAVRNLVTDDLYCVLSVVSSHPDGIKEFVVDIVSDKLTPEELEGVGLKAHLDMVNPGDLADPLSNLGFPVNVGGKKNVEFSITGFMPMLKVLGEGDHDFILKVTDGYGTTTTKLMLHTN